MKTITMTQSQTDRYDNDELSVIRELRLEADRIREDNETVEIYTADGIAVIIVQD